MAQTIKYQPVGQLTASGIEINGHDCNLVNSDIRIRENSLEKGEETVELQEIGEIERLELLKGDKEENNEMVKKRKTIELGTSEKPILRAWCSMFVSIVCIAAIGPTFKYLLVEKHVAPARAAFWRNFCSLVFLIPPAIWEVLKMSEDEKQAVLNGLEEIATGNYTVQDENRVDVRLPCTSFSLFWYMLIIAVCWSGSLIVWVNALNFTTIVRAALFYSVYQLMLVGYMRYVGVLVSKGEIIGVLISIFGIFLAMFDNFNFTGFADRALIGDAMCMLGALFLCCQIVTATQIRKVIPLYFYSCFSTILVCIITAVYTLAFEGTDFTVSRKGIIGAFEADIFLIIFIFAFAFGVFGVLTRAFAVRHIDPVVYGTVQLLDVPIAGFISFFAGLEGYPQTWTIIGGFVLVCGIVVVVIYEHKRKSNSRLQINEADQNVELKSVIE